MTRTFQHPSFNFVLECCSCLNFFSLYYFSQWIDRLILVFQMRIMILESFGYLVSEDKKFPFDSFIIHCTHLVDVLTFLSSQMLEWCFLIFFWHPHEAVRTMGQNAVQYSPFHEFSFFSFVADKKFVNWTLRVLSVHGQKAPLPFIKSVEVIYWNHCAYFPSYCHFNSNLWQLRSCVLESRLKLYL